MQNILIPLTNKGIMIKIVAEKNLSIAKPSVMLLTISLVKADEKMLIPLKSFRFVIGYFTILDISVRQTFFNV